MQLDDECRIEEGDDGVMNRLMPFGVCFGESVASDSGADGQEQGGECRQAASTGRW